MELTFESLGKFVRLIDERNTDLVTVSVLGINIDKYFMPSVANVIGTDLSRYKLLRKGRFACNPMHVGRDYRLPVARYTEEIPAIVSPAYFMFEIVDEKIIEPEYLMLCFRRPEFDRMCWFRTDASVRGGISWEDVCDLVIPVLPIEEQRRIVHDYQVITDRITLLNRINENLEQQAHVLCEKWVADNSKNITMRPLADIAEINPETYSPKEKWEYVNYLDTSSITKGVISEIQMIKPNTEKLPSRARRIIKANDIVYSTVRPNQNHFGIVSSPLGNMLVSTGFAVIRSKCSYICSPFIYHFLTSPNFIEKMQQLAEQSTSTFPSVKPSDIGTCLIPCADETEMSDISEKINDIYAIIHANYQENKLIATLRDTLLPN